MCQNLGGGGLSLPSIYTSSLSKLYTTHKPRKIWNAPTSKICPYQFRPVTVLDIFTEVQCRPRSRALGSAKSSKEPDKTSAHVNSTRTPGPDTASPLPTQLHLSHRPRPFTEGAPHASAKHSPVEALEALSVLQQGWGTGQSQGKYAGWQLKGLHPWKNPWATCGNLTPALLWRHVSTIHGLYRRPFCW